MRTPRCGAIWLHSSIATEVEQRYVDIDVVYGPDYGRSLGYSEELAPVGTQPVDILFDIDRERFWDLYVDLMTRDVAAAPGDAGTTVPSEEGTTVPG